VNTVLNTPVARNQATVSLSVRTVISVIKSLKWQYSTPHLNVTPADGQPLHLLPPNFHCYATRAAERAGAVTIWSEWCNWGKQISWPFANDNLGSVEWAMETFPSPRTPPTPPSQPILSAREAKTRWLQQELQVAESYQSLSLCSLCCGLSQDTIQSTHCRSLSPLARTTVQMLTAVCLRIQVSAIRGSAVSPESAAFIQGVPGGRDKTSRECSIC
jgi:hypothetical protein